MSITALDVIKRSMRLIQVIGADATPTAAEAADGLYALNSMLDAWGIERLMVYQVQQATYSWAANAASKTIGSGGDFNATRPTKIADDGNFFRTTGNIDYPLQVLPRTEYDEIVFKSAGGAIPEYLFHDTGYPLMTLYAFPVPSQTLTLHLNTWKPLQSFTALTTALALPPGYQSAIEYNLAQWIAPEFGASAVAAAQRSEKRAATLKTAIKNVNQPDLISKTELPLVGRRSRIESDS